jgi:hypothetical protein
MITVLIFQEGGFTAGAVPDFIVKDCSMHLLKVKSAGVAMSLVLHCFAEPAEACRAIATGHIPIRTELSPVPATWAQKVQFEYNFVCELVEVFKLH